MTSGPTNRFGRRGGRGWRPWLLLPKVIAVGIYIGALASACVIWHSADFESLDAADPRRGWMIAQMRLLMVYLAVPALLAAMLLGIGLLMQMPRVLLRLRWLQVKLILLAVVIPTAHLFVSSRLRLVREALAQGRTDDVAAAQFGVGLILTLLGSILIVILARLKPRLGQNWARAYTADAASIISTSRPTSTRIAPPSPTCPSATRRG